MMMSGMSDLISYMILGLLVLAVVSESTGSTIIRTPDRDPTSTTDCSEVTNLPCPGEHPNADHEIALLPDNQVSRNRRSVEGNDGPYYWRTNITVLGWTSSNVTITFDLAPEQYGFNIYHVKLDKCSPSNSSVCLDVKNILPWQEYDVTTQETGSDTGTLTFDADLEPGFYRIQVRPSREIGGVCVCVSPYGGCECTVSSQTFTIPVPVRPADYWKYITISVAVIVFITVIVLLLKLICYCVPCFPGKITIIIASSVDTDDHMKVLAELKVYLESLGCYVRVFFGRTLPSPAQLAQADDVLMICSSEEIQQQVSAIDKAEHQVIQFNDAFLQTYAYVKSRNITNDDGKTKFCMLWFSYMPYPEVGHQIPKIPDYDLSELDKFIFGDSVDNNKIPRRCIDDQTRFYRVQLAIQAVQNQREPAMEEGHLQTVDVVETGMSDGPVSTVSWATAGPDAGQSNGPLSTVTWSSRGPDDAQSDVPVRMISGDDSGIDTGRSSGPLSTITWSSRGPDTDTISMGSTDTAALKRSPED